jgi:hypothetical protein
MNAGKPKLTEESSHPRLGLELSVQLPAIDAQTHLHLMQAYTAAIDIVFPLLTDRDHSLRPDLANANAADRFTLFMIYSIACCLVSNTDERWHLLGKSCHKEAMLLLDSCTAEADITTLKSILLLAIHSLTDPQSGNLGQQIALASRLVIELGTQDLPPEHSALLESMYSIVFCLENDMCGALDRPATLLEPTWELSFDPTNPSRYLCSLYRVQNCFRKRKLKSSSHLPNEVTNSLLQVALKQTELMLSPTAAHASQLLSAFANHTGLETFLMPHWAYRAALIVLDNRTALEPCQVLEAYGEACELLSQYATKWPEVSVLLQNVKRQLKNS